MWKRSRKKSRCWQRPLRTKPDANGGYRDCYDTVIIGTGIAGSVLAFELEKRKADYFICTGQKSPLFNTSSISYGHCRTPTGKDVDETVEKSVSMLGEDRERMRFVYSRSDLVLELFGELNLDFERRSFGIIPSGRKRGGSVILEKLHGRIPRIETETELVDFNRSACGFDVFLEKNKTHTLLKAKRLVLATGGYGGSFEHTDNVSYKSYRVFDVVRRNGGEIINLGNIFIHPFGYRGGKEILIGNETKTGEFVDSDGNPVFDEETRRLVKCDSYHEIFSRLLEQADACRKGGSKVYFVNSGRKLEIVPCVHYTAGGIKTDYAGKAMGFENLFAVGECGADGSRNGGRLPGYPFTSAIVYGKALGGTF